MDWLKFFYDLAVSFFKAFAYAVQEYPLPTAAVFLVAGLIYMERQRKMGQHDPLFALVVFVGGVIAANVVGWIFNAVLGVFQKLFGWSEVFVGPFSKNPVAFLLSLLGTLIIGYSYVMYRYRFTLRQIPIIIHAVVVFTALVLAYIFTNVYIQMMG